jgi:nicotinamidase/pyrazinamidase
MANVLIVIDTLEGFFRKGYPLFCGEDALKILPFIKKKIEQYNQRYLPVIFLTDSHEPDDREFEMFPPHCVKGTKEAEVLPEILDLAKKKVVIPKTRFSGFQNTNLEFYLNGFAPEVVEVTGVCTDICVLFTVEGLRDRNYKVRVYRNGVASFNQEAHEFALRHMEKVLGVEVV